MTEEELQQTIWTIESEEPDLNERARRIAFVQETYASQQREKAEQAERDRQSAESVMRAELKRAFMKNPAVTEADFEELYPELRRRKLIEDTLRGGSDEIDDETFNAYKERFSRKRESNGVV